MVARFKGACPKGRSEKLREGGSSRARQRLYYHLRLSLRSQAVLLPRHSLEQSHTPTEIQEERQTPSFSERNVKVTLKKEHVEWETLWQSFRKIQWATSGQNNTGGKKYKVQRISRLLIKPQYNMGN